MKRFMKTAFAAQAGATVGYVVYQARRQGEASGDEDGRIVAAAPAVNLAIALAVGLATRRRGLAFLTGFGLSAAFGTGLGDRIPGIERVRRPGAERGTAVTGSIET